VRRVRVSPDGALAIVPFGALFEDREVALVPSGTVHGLLFPDRATRGDGVLALGDPTYPSTPEPATVLALRGGGERTPLPGTRAEAVAISAEPFLGPRASEAELARALPGRPRWRALHFGCHGFVDPRRPLLSSLALAPDPEHDGYLTVQEVLRMRIPADLVTVSACESGRGRFYKGEGVMGFARAFMFAGAPRVVVSLWKVDDAATTALMTEFYRLWNPRDGSPGIAAATALTRAQAHVRADPRWAHPRFWAGWALWGLPQ
jgi:CHAT domain-containing protein